MRKNGGYCTGKEQTVYQPEVLAGDNNKAIAGAEQISFI